MQKENVLDKILKIYELTKEKCNKAVTEEHLRSISRKCCRKWRGLPASLGLASIVQSDIDSMHHIPPQDLEREKRHSFLAEWKQKMGSDATYMSLIVALLNIECREDAESVCEILKESLIVSADATSLGALSEDVKSDLIFQLSKNLKEIEKKYSSFVLCLCKCIEKEDATTVKLYLQNLSYFKPRQDMQSMSDVEKLEDSTKMSEIFCILSKYASFLDYDIFQALLEKFCTEEDRKDPDLKYSEYLNAYIDKLKISEFISINPKLKDLCATSVKKFNLKFDIEESCYFSRIIDLTFCVASIFHCMPSQIGIVTVEKGCVDVTFQVPVTVADATFTEDALQLTMKQIEEFQALPVAWLKYNNNIFYFKEAFFEADLNAGCFGAGISVLTHCMECFWNTCKEGHHLENDPNHVCKEEKTALLFRLGPDKVLAEISVHHGAVHVQNGGSVLSLSKFHSSLHEWLQDKCEEFLISASKDGDVELVKKSLEIGVNPNAREKDKYGWTALLWACEKGHIDVVDCLLAHDNVDVNVCDSQNWTGLILSSRRGNLSIVKKLLYKGADIDILTRSLWSALHWTAQEGHTEVARLLLERGATATTQDKAGFSPFLQACQDGKFDIVKLIMKHTPELDMNECTKNGWSGIMVSTKNGHEDIVRHLVDNGSDPHHQKEDGVTALHIATFKGHKDIVKYLCVNQRLAVNIQDNNGITPLMYAAKQGHFESVRTLFENGRADPNIQENDNGWTALFFAVEAGQHEVLDYLLRSGRTDVTQRDTNGTSIVDIAAALGTIAIHQLISQHYQSKNIKLLLLPKTTLDMDMYKTMLKKMDWSQMAITGSRAPRTQPISAGYG